MNELNETIDLMTSKDYKDRFKAEYYQLEIRVRKLRKFLYKIETGEIDQDVIDLDVYNRQLKAMRQYMHILRIRASMEKIEL